MKVITALTLLIFNDFRVFQLASKRAGWLDASVNLQPALHKALRNPP
jgi:hypothetical protein